MQRATQRALNRLNHAFYAGETEAEFSATRSAPWPGWFQIATRVDLPAAPSVLDVGCGNGRFARFLSSWRPGARYLGVDLSAPLLARARALKPLRDMHLLHADLVEEGLDALPDDARFDLVVAFGLMHHIPGRAARQGLMRSMAQRLLPAGTLCVSFWQPPPFRPDRLRAPRWAGVPESLEPGDHLLAWRNGEATRYVHLADERERAELCAATGLHCALVQSRERGDHNDYVLLHARH